MGKYTSPAYKTLLAEVAGVEVVDERTVRFRFSKPNRELPLTVGGIPVFSRQWGVVDGKAKPFDQVVTDIPLAVAPTRLGQCALAKTSLTCVTRNTGPKTSTCRRHRQL